MKMNRQALLDALKSPEAMRSLRFQGRETPVPIAELSPAEASLADWLGRLKLLHGIPFNYLVPDERMLPMESIRFFYCDTIWLDYVTEGAMSLGRSTSVEEAHDRAFLGDLHALSRHGMKVQRRKVVGHLIQHMAPAEKARLITEPIPANEIVTGFLLRSGVVSGWEGLQVEGFRDLGMTQPCVLLRMDHLSPNVLLCLFEGELRKVRIHEYPEVLHFGVHVSSDAPPPPPPLVKSFRYVVDTDGGKAGEQVPDHVAPQIGIKDYTRGETRVVRMNDLARAMKDELANTIGYSGPFTSAEFALEMVEGVEAVSFTIEENGP
jgi:hypothetical protein